MPVQSITHNQLHPATTNYWWYGVYKDEGFVKDRNLLGSVCDTECDISLIKRSHESIILINEWYGDISTVIRSSTFGCSPYRVKSKDMKKYYTTKQVAEKIGAGHQTLLRWLYAKKLAEPERIIFGGQNLRLWTKDDLQRARTYKVKGAAERRGRSTGRPKKK